MAGGFTEALSRACGRVGIVERVTMYGLRRETITSFARNESVDQSRKLALHAPSTLETFGRYDYGFDLSAVRFADNARNRIRQFFEDPALIRLPTFSTKEEQRHVKEVINNREDVALLDRK